MNRYSVLMLSVLISSAVAMAADRERQTLHFSYITTITGGIRAIGGKPVVDLALEEINNRTDILQNYTLNYTTIRNSECTRTGALNAFFQDFSYTTMDGDLSSAQANDTSNFLALLCCGCSPATIPVAEISHYWNIPQIAFAAAANELVDRSRFQSFFRALPSFEFIGESIAELARTFEWKQMAIITQDETLFTGVNTVLTGIFNKENWVLDTSALITSNEGYFSQEVGFPYDIAFNWRSNADFRIIHINAYAEYAYLVLCRAHELGLVPPRYVWITPMWYNREWWKPISDKLSFACTESQLLQVLSGSIGVVPDGYFTLENDTVTTVSQRRPSSFSNEYKRRLKLSKYDDDLEELGIAGVAYDSVWSIALALDRAVDRIVTKNASGCENITVGSIVPLEEFNYGNQLMGCILKQSFAELRFQGITGTIEFNSFGSRPDNVLLVQQYRTMANNIFERVTVAHIVIGEQQEKNGFYFREGETALMLWRSGVPYDGSADDVIHPNSYILAGFYYALASIGLLCTVACLIFNIIFRNKKVVKLSSSNLNYLIIAGAMFLYICVYLSVSPIHTKWLATFVCNLRYWMFSLGYTLCFGVILSKAWRIYYIFSNPTAKKKNIKDWLLLVMIVVVVLIDMFILLIGTAIPSSTLTGIRVKDGEQFRHVTDEGINQQYYVYVCSVPSDDSVIWLGVSFAYKGLLQVVAMFMAFHTRRVKIKALNDSKETGAIIYINSIILVLMIVAVFILESYHNVHSAIFGLALMVQASMFLGLLFIPKAINLYRDPEGSAVFSTNNQNHGPRGSNVGLSKIQKAEKSDVKDNPSSFLAAAPPQHMSTINASINNGSNPSAGLAEDPADTIRILRERIQVLESSSTSKDNETDTEC